MISEETMKKAVICVLTLLLAAGAARARDAKWQTGGRNVLILYRSDDADKNGNGKGDSLEAAEYYAARRNIPRRNMLGLKLATAKRRHAWTYREVYDRILTPVAAKLATPLLASRICYIATMPGIPITVATGIKEPAGLKRRDWFQRIGRRSIDQWLISVDANLAAGVNKETGAPGSRPGKALGGSSRDLTLPLFGRFGNPARARHFRQLRSGSKARFGFYLVTRLGNDLRSSRDMLDGALYAERFLRLPGPLEKNVPRPTIWLDQKFRFAGDHVSSLDRAIPLVRGAGGSPFAIGRGLQRIWPLVIDNHLNEIGLPLKETGLAHKPTVTGVVAKDGVNKRGILVDRVKKRSGRTKRTPTGLYFPPGCTVTNGKATARVTGLGRKTGRVLLSSTTGFAPGDTVTYTWPGEFPTDNCFIFYGFYGLSKFEDVFKFLPGALGIHTDSGCMKWAKGAMSRGIAATFGVTNEPLSAGIPYGDQVLIALAAGYDWAEAVYGGLRLGQRWCGVTFGDPLYAPFRSLRKKDITKPVLGEVEVRTDRKTTILSASLAGESEDELADVALFRLEYGPTTKYGTTIDFFDWPDPAKSRGVKGRRFGYSRHAAWSLKGLDGKTTYHYRITARDPAGNETVSDDRVLTQQRD